MHSLYDQLIQHMIAVSKEAIESRGRCAIVLTGGESAQAFYKALATSPARRELAWEKIHLFWTDERWVPADHPRSNYGMARDALLTSLDIPAENIHSMLPQIGEVPEEGARRYEDEMRRHFDLAAGEWPRFDLILLGLGDDGHIASLFPGSSSVDDKEHLTIATLFEELNEPRISLTLPVMNHAAHICFLATGAKKSAIVQRVLENHSAACLLPAQQVHPHKGRLSWFLDEAAASRLTRQSLHGEDLHLLAG